MSIRKFIPNLLTLGNLFCGCIAVWLSFNTPRGSAFPLYSILVAALFDVLDGLVARMLHSESQIGADLDSLADLVSFAIAPCFILLQTLGMNRFDYDHCPFDTILPIKLLPILVLPLFAAYRLAKFNRDTRPRQYFYGLPVPANALFWIGWSRILLQYENSRSLVIVTYILILLFGILMVSNLPLLSLKTHLPARSYREKHINIALLLLGLSGITLVALMGWSGLVPFMAIYITTSPFIIRSIERKKLD